jgi:hypothetical protein
MRKYYPCPYCFGIVRYREENKAYTCGTCEAECNEKQLEQELRKFNGETEEEEEQDETEQDRLEAEQGQLAIEQYELEQSR